LFSNYLPFPEPQSWPPFLSLRGHISLFFSILFQEVFFDPLPPPPPCFLIFFLFCSFLLVEPFPFFHDDNLKECPPSSFSSGKLVFSPPSLCCVESRFPIRGCGCNRSPSFFSAECAVLVHQVLLSPFKPPPYRIEFYSPFLVFFDRNPSINKKKNPKPLFFLATSLFATRSVGLSLFLSL